MSRPFAASPPLNRRTDERLQAWRAPDSQEANRGHNIVGRYPGTDGERVRRRWCGELSARKESCRDENGHLGCDARLGLGHFLL